MDEISFLSVVKFEFCKIYVKNYGNKPEVTNAWESKGHCYYAGL
jgi:hypothetical protein